MISEEAIAPKESSFSISASVLPWVIFALGALFYCYEYLLRISPSVMTNDLMSTYSINAAVLGNLVAYYYYIYTPMQIPVGVLMDRFGPRRLLIMACLLCVAGAYWFSHTSHAQALGFARLLIGFGSAFGFVGVLKLASLWLPENRFAFASGLALMLGMIGAMVGNDIMAALVTRTGWQQTVTYTAYAGIGLAALFFIFMRDRPARKPQNPVIPETTFRKLWPELKVLIKNPLIWLNGIISGLIYLPTSVFAELWGVPFIQNAYGMTREGAAAAVSMMFLGIAVGGPLAGFISDRIRRRRLPIVIGGVVSGLIAIVLIYIPGLPKEVLYATLFLFGMVSSVQILVFAIGREISPSGLAGTAVAFTNMLTTLSGVIFQPMIGRLLVAKWDGLKAHGVPIYTAMDYRYALLSIPVATFLGVFLLMFMKETHAQVTDVDEEGLPAEA